MKKYILAAFACFSILWAQSDKVVFIQMDPPEDIPLRESYHAKYNGQKVEKELEATNPLLNLAKYVYQEKIVYNSECLDPMMSNCFKPEMKMIYKDYTYVMGNHLAHVVKFKNTAPFTPGATLLPLDFLFTQTTLTAANMMRDELFSRSYAVYFKQLGLPALVEHSDIYKKALAEGNKRPDEEIEENTTASTDGSLNLEAVEEDLGLDLDMGISLDDVGMDDELNAGPAALDDLDDASFDMDMDMDFDMGMDSFDADDTDYSFDDGMDDFDVDAEMDMDFDMDFD